MAATNQSDRAYGAAHFGFMLDGAPEIGIIRSVEGGGLKADVTQYKAGHVHGTWRQLGKPKFEDIKLMVGMSMSQPFYDWIKSFFQGQTVRKNGSILAADFNYNTRARRDFREALIKEISLPALNAADKAAAYMGVGIAAEMITYSKGDGNRINVGQGMDKQKLWSTAHFNFSIDNFDAACRRVNKVESFTIKQPIIEHHVGGQREPYKLHGRIEYPNITFTVPEVDIHPLAAHFKTYGVQGQPAQRFNGHIEYLDNQKKVLATLNFTNSDIVSITPDRGDSTSEEMKMVKVELYNEGMTMQFGS